MQPRIWLGIIQYLLYKAEKLSVHLSVCLSIHYADISAVSAWIEAGLARNES